MLVPLLLQLAPWMPPLPPAAVADPEDVDLLQSVVATTPWPAEDLENWFPMSPEENQAMAAMVQDADLTTLRFLALASAGVEASSPLGRALFRSACQMLPEAEALACLLAPTAPDEESALALADLALRQDRSLPVRAAALGRLLEAGYSGAWPLAKAVLLTGTTQDTPELPYANWTRGGRYELPKRLLLVSIRELLPAKDQEQVSFEPNSSWADQVLAAEALEAAVKPFLRQMPIVADYPTESLSERQKAALTLLQSTN